MAPIGHENFQRLEEFPSFISCIKCFGRPIIPPLLTASRRHELKQLRIAATNKEAEIQRKNEFLRQRLAIHVASRTQNDYRPDFQSSMQESCALWYPSSKDNQKGISVAISKFPTSEIYSSVHTGAIVCSNVIENSHAYAARLRDSLFGSESSLIDCAECSHSNVNLECSLCQAEFNQSFHNRSFTSEISPEVPCRTFSLLQQNVGVMDLRSNSVVEDTECESLPTVICNQKFIPPDTDSESNATYMSQSTDLEKYMEFSCEFNSPDNSAMVWDSKSVSQQYTLSRSDDASSETIVNTENELTPCASMMAELTDNIEDELSNADETAGVSDNKVTVGAMKRAHSVDSYMKILQTCARNMNVKKSLSEPFNTNQETSSGVDDTKIPIISKASLLIKEDSKESEESKDIPEKDVSVQENKEILSKDDKALELNADNKNSFQKKHIRQNSYTLDHPSSVLIMAHADCTCNFDAKCISPHCSALKDENGVASNFAFIKENIEVDIPQLHPQAKNLPVASSEDVAVNNEDATSTVVDVFPLVEEDSCEKSDSGNTKLPESTVIPENVSSTETKNDSKSDEEEHLSEIMFSEDLSLSSNEKHQEYVRRIYQELQETHEMRVKELFEEQNQQWLKLQEQFKEQEKLLIEKLKQTLISSGSSCKNEENDQMKSNVDCCEDKNIHENKSVSERCYEDDKNIPEDKSVSDRCYEDDKNIPEDKSVSEKVGPPTLNCSDFSSNQVSSENSLVHYASLSVSSGSPQFICSPSKTSVFPQNARASISPSRKCKSPINSPSIPVANIESKQLFKDSDASMVCNYKSIEDHVYSINESTPNINGFPFTTSSLLPHSNSHPKSSITTTVPIDKKCDKMPVCFCDDFPQQCKCTSFNGYCEYNVNTELPSHSRKQNSVLNVKGPSYNSDVTSFQNFSSSSGTQTKNVNPHDFNINCHISDNSKKAISSSSRKSSDSISEIQNATSSFSDNVDLPSVVHHNEQRNSSSQSFKEKSMLSVDSIFSLCAKTLNNGTFTQDVIINKRLIDDPVLKKKFEKLPAFVKGYLTRRLFKTERVKDLIKTLQDTALLIGKLSEDLTTKGDPVSQRDVDFHRQLIVQLMTTFHNVYDIFCTISTKERMKIISESRNSRLRQKRADQNQELSCPVITKAPDPAPSKKHKLSSATLKALERKRRSAIDSRTYSVEDLKNTRSRSVIDMRTYTIDDLPSFRGRTCSSMSSKCLSVSPSSTYKTSIGMPLKRKTASAKSSGSRRCLQHKWVP